MRTDHRRLRIESEFPFPIAHKFHTAVEEKRSRESLCALLMATLEYAGYVLIADYLSSEERDAEIDASLARLLKAAPPTGWWHEIVTRIIQCFAARSRTPIVHELGDLATHPVAQQLDQLVQWRNNWAHHRPQFNTTRFWDSLMSIMERIVGIHCYAMFCVLTGRMRDGLHVYDAVQLTGSNPLFPNIECRSDIALDAGAVYLFSRSSRQLLPLSPLVLLGRCEECGERHFWRYDHPSNHRIVYTAVPSGHELASVDAYDQMENALARPRSARLTPRFFSIPGCFFGMPRTLAVGDRIGPYEVEELITLGGPSQLYRVVDSRTHDAYALKLLPLECSRDPLLARRMQEEAAILRRFENPAVARLRDSGEVFGDRYLVLDLDLGGTVAGQHCRNLGELKTPIAEDAIVSIGRQLCDGLHYIHSQGVIHQDLKPDNVLVAGDRLVLNDFGISRTGHEPKCTTTGMPVGTPEYMAPEQVCEEEVDQRTDIYAVGCMLYELATGRPPYHAEAPLATMLHHLHTRPQPIQELNTRISEGLAGIIFKALQKRPELRHQNARELCDHLVRVKEAPAGSQVIPGQEAPRDVLEKLRLHAQRRFRRRVAFVIAACTFALLAVFLARDLYREWSVRSLADRARQAWRQGEKAWPRACESLHALVEYAPTHVVTRQLLREISEYGTLIITTEPAAAMLRVVPDAEEGAAIDLTLLPRLVTNTETRAAGTRITLTPGHYRVIVESGDITYKFPVFVSQMAYTRTKRGWEARGRLLPADVAPWTPEHQRDPARFVFAEEQRIENLVLSKAVPDGYVAVPPRPCWLASHDSWPQVGEMAGPPANPEFKARGLLQSGLESAYMKRGFLIGIDEVSVADFCAWHERFGRQAFQWEIDALARELCAQTRLITPERLAACWCEDLQRLDENLASAAREGLVIKSCLTAREACTSRETLCLAKVQQERFEVLRYEARLDKSLKAQRAGDPSNPVMDVKKRLALMYARTHRQTMRHGFHTWIASELERTATLVDRLVAVLADCRSAVGGRLTLAAIPSDLTLSTRTPDLTSFGEQPLAMAYIDWLLSTVRFAGSAPASFAVAWARANRDRLPPHLIERVDDIAQRLADPCTYLYASENSDIRDLLWTYEKALAEVVQACVHDAPASERAAVEFDAASVATWLEHVLSEEKKRLNALAELCANTAGATPESLYAMEIPWSLRAEFGCAAGWNLPTVAQWERAARGPDSREYPWGNHAANGTPTTGPELRGPRSPAANRVGNDVSPYGVWCLAGNMSEWVLKAPHMTDADSDVLKGGNWWHGGFYARVGCMLAVTASARGPYAGIRVVKDWGPSR